METNSYNEVRHEIINVLNETGKYTNKVAVEICGKLKYLNEAEVRALQVIAARKAIESKEEFNAFVKNITIYNGRTKTEAKRNTPSVIEILEDGRLKDPFRPGFYNVDKELVLQIFDFTKHRLGSLD